MCDNTLEVRLFLLEGDRYSWINIGPILIISGKPLQAREAWDHRQLRSLSSILRSALTEATKMAVRGNMHMGTRVNEVPDFNSEVKFEI